MKSKVKIDWSDFLLEIVSVFIGITIAFAVDNWKEEKNNKKIEKAYLTGISEDIDKDINSLKRIIWFDSLAIIYCRQIIDDFEKNQLPTDSIVKYIGTNTWVSRFTSTTSNFESLKFSNSFNLISNKVLLTKLIETYNFQNVISTWDSDFQFFNQTHLEPILYDSYVPFHNYFDKDSFPADDHSITNNAHLLKKVMACHDWRKEQLRLYKSYLKSFIDVKEMLKKELRLREN